MDAASRSKANQQKPPTATDIKNIGSSWDRVNKRCDWRNSVPMMLNKSAE
jgi:hypothetical protein